MSSSSDCVTLNHSLRTADESQHDCLLPENLKILTDDQRYIFMGVFMVLSGLSLAGNCAAIYSISQRKCRYIQKTCIIFLAASDVLSTVVIATNNVETFSHELLVWTIGATLCSLIPMLQMAGIMASSIALMFIAMDRYRNVVHALSKRWKPPPATCHTVAASLCVVILLVSYPMYNFFSQESITLVYVREGQVEFVDAFVCVSFDKEEMKIYYIAMVIVIFLPLLLVFLWFYYNIASLVWKHRKPVSSFYQNEASADRSTASEIRIKNVKKMGKHDIKVERKIRTFKIIITLMLVFIVCRLPYFTVFIIKLSGKENRLWLWLVNYSFIALHILNCCLNPLLYTFLNPTLTLWIRAKKSAKDFVGEICCFCFGRGEFDEFEKENPFVVESRSRGNSKVKFEENVREIQAKY